MTAEMVRVQFLDDQSYEIPLANLVAVCGLGSDNPIRIPVASKETFGQFQAFVNKHKGVAPSSSGRWSSSWDDPIIEWEEEFFEKFTDKTKLKDLEAVAKLTKQHTLQELCKERIGELILGRESEGEDNYGDDDDDDDDEHHNEVIRKKSPSPDTLPKDEDEYWESYYRENDELYGEDRESP